MVPFTVVKCLKSFEGQAVPGEYYIAYPTKNGTDRVILPNGESLMVVTTKISYRRPFLKQFELVSGTYLRNHKECRVYANRNLNELIQLLKNDTSKQVFIEEAKSKARPEVIV